MTRYKRASYLGESNTNLKENLGRPKQIPKHSPMEKALLGNKRGH